VLRLLVVQGPNLALLGTREPAVYGTTDLSGLQTQLDTLAAELGVTLRHVCSNHEGVLLDAIHEARLDCAGILINPGGLGHTSVCLRDALVGVGLPFVEVHISNVHAREAFRHRSLLSDVAAGTVQGFGLTSYHLGLRGLVARLGGAT
jgi:3-dehydroquinate dehydratase-2